MNVPVADVVKRIKCEIIDTVSQKVREDRHRFGFLTQWAAKVHLTLVVDDTVGVNPGATIINPLDHPGTSFSVGFGGGLSTQAVRTEDIEFFLSFPEMAEEFVRLQQTDQFEKRYSSCQFDDGFLLESHLDLKAVVDKALSPIAEDVLHKGPHPSIGASPPAIPTGEFKNLQKSLAKFSELRSGAPATSFAEFKSQNPQLQFHFDQIERGIEAAHPTANLTDDEKKRVEEARRKELDEIASNAAAAASIEAKATQIVKNVVAPLFEIAGVSVPQECLADVTAERYQAVVFASVVSVKKLDVENATGLDASKKSLDEEKAAFRSTVDHATALIEKLRDCPAAEPKPKAGPQLYDPIDLISETVNFYITTSGSVTPIWKLVRVTAPLAPTFLSANRKDTNTLILVLGRPTLTAGVASGGSTPMNQQILSSILAQAVSNQGR